MAFHLTWQNYWASTSILQKIVNECVQATNKMHPGWLDVNEECYAHRMQALKYMITVKLYSRTRYNNRTEKRVNATNRKVKNLLNK